jgi:signal transduction histidine kinase/CheY-like chemotaxis protein
MQILRLWVIVFLSVILSLFVYGDAVVYRSATEFDYPPFSVTDGGVADGFSVELLKAVAEVMDLQITFEIGQWDIIKNQLKDGELDVLPLVGHTEERDVYFDFTVPYMVMHGNIFVRKDNETIKSQWDLKGKAVLVMTGDNAQEYAIEKKLTDKLISVTTYTEAFELLSSGKYDAVLAQSIVGQKIIRDLNLKNIKTVTAITEDGQQPTTIRLKDFQQKFCFAVKEGDKELLGKLNEGLAIVSASGRYQEIYDKWFPFLIDKGISVKQLTLYIMITVVLMSIIFLVFSLLMIKREVTLKTIDLKRANEELHIQRQKADAANEAKSQFLANMSHEIRTPLNGLMGTVQLLDMMDLNPDQRECIEITKSSSEMLLKVINDILDYSKIEAGMLQIENKPFDMEDLLSDLIKLFMAAASEKGLALTYALEKPIPNQLYGDAFRLRQVLSNLIDNAIKFTKSGAVSLEVHLKESSEEGEMNLEFVVQDTGVGIPKEVQNKLFKSFSQVDESNSRVYGGTGLGLAISKGIIHKMGGDIWIDQTQEVGSAFCFTAAFKVDGPVHSPIEYHQNGLSSYIVSNLRLLVVDDDAVSGIVIEKLAIKLGWQVLVVQNSRAALQALDAERYDLILMDIQLPELDGYELTRLIREREGLSSTPTIIIAMTAFALESDREKCMAMGMDDYLSKPIDFKEFEEVVSTWAKTLETQRAN